MSLLPHISNNTMQITYDKKADAMYIYFQRDKKVARTVELSDLLIADLDRRGKILGVEVLCASRQLGKKGKVKPAVKSDMFSLDIPIPIAA